MPPVATEEIVYAPLGTMTYKRGKDGFLYVTGTVSDTALDLDEQRCDAAWLKSEVPEWMKLGNVRVMHDRVTGGKAQTLTQDGNSWATTIKVTNPQAATDVEEGVLNGLSIGIKSPRIIKSDDAPNGKIVGGKIIEVSLVDRPANPNCKVEIAKMAGGALTKADGIELEDCPPCDTCNGTGQVSAGEGMGVCPDCAGSGEGSIDIRPSDNGGNMDDGVIGEKTADPDCKTCKGTGKIKDGHVDCPDCVQKAIFADQFGWTDADKADWSPFQKSLMPDTVKKDYSDKDRQSMANNGTAMPNGGFPIKTVQDLKNAIQSIGRAKDRSATIAHIKTRAKALGQESLIPDSWKSAAATLVKALTLSKAADGDTWMHDPAMLAAIRDGLVECVIAELNEFATGDDERWDIDQLTGALSTFLSWWQDESFEGETSSPFKGDSMSFVGLGVNPDLIKAASAQEATDADKDALRAETLKALGLEDVGAIKSTAATALEEVTNFKERLATVEKMAAPRGISKRAQEHMQAKSAQVESLRSDAERYKALAGEWADPQTKALYLAESRKFAQQADELHKSLEGE